MQNKGGVEEKGWRARLASALQNWMCLKVGFGKVFKWEQSQGLWWEGVCAIYPADESPDHVRIVLGEAMELEDPEKNEIVIGHF